MRTVIGKINFEITREKIEERLKNVVPARISKYSTSINSQIYPVKQVIAVTLGISPLELGTTVAIRILKDLGYSIITSS